MKSTYYRELQKYIAAGMSKVDAQLKLEEDYFDFVKSRGLQYRNNSIKSGGHQFRNPHAKRKHVKTCETGPYNGPRKQTERHHGPVI
jgi:hypothetical protein